MENKNGLDIHADDFGVSCHGSKDIVECLAEGGLDSISVIANMSCFPACMEIYNEKKAVFPKEPLICVHLNVLDGKPLCPKEEVPDLVDENGFFALSWGSLFMLNFKGGKKKAQVKEQLKKEFRAQIRVVQEAFLQTEIRLDSHQHPHMIPFVFDAVMELCDEFKGKVSFVRLAKEPLKPFLTAVSLYPTYSPVNIIKNVLLNLFSIGNRKKLEKRGIAYELLWGLVMSGNMDGRRIEKLLPAMRRSAEKQKTTLEILFHPGIMLEEEKTEEYVKEGFFSFYCSANRSVEKEAVKKLQQIR